MVTGIKTNLQKTFQFVFGDMVAVHLPKERRNWKFDMRWDVGIYVGQPEHSVEASLVYFPYKNQMLVRTDVAKMDMTPEDYKRFYFKRYDLSLSLRRRLKKFRLTLFANDVVPGSIYQLSETARVNPF